MAWGQLRPTRANSDPRARSPWTFLKATVSCLGLGAAVEDRETGTAAQGRDNTSHAVMERVPAKRAAVSRSGGPLLAANSRSVASTRGETRILARAASEPRAS